MEDFEEIAPHILFDLKNRSNSLSKSSSNATTTTASPQINNATGPQDADSVPASPVFGRSSLASSFGLKAPTTNNQSKNSRSPSNSFVLFDNSSASSSNNDLDQSLKSSTSTIFNNMFYQSSSSSPFSSIPIPLRANSPINNLRSSGDSLLSTSTDSITNSCSLISLSSSPLQSVPSSPPSKPIKFHSFKQISPVKSQQTSTTSTPSNNTPTSSPMIISSSLSTPSSPSQSNGGGGANSSVLCNLNDCLLCQRGQPELLIKSPTWASIMRVVFFTLHHEMREKPFFSLKTDVYDFMTTHWDILCLNKKRSDNWHKQIQDMLSHSKNIFESGMDTYKQNGFWRLKQIVDPWTLQKGGRKNSSGGSSMPSPLLSNNSPVLIPSSPLANCGASSSSNIASHASSPRQSSNSINIPRLNTSPLILSHSLYDDFTKVKRSSIDMLLSTSLENLDMDSPRKKRLSDSGEVQKNYNDVCYTDELFIDDNNQL